MKKIIIFGGHGTGSVIAGAILDAKKSVNKEYEFAGFLNDNTVGNIAGYPILGKFGDVNKFIENGFYFLFTAHKIGSQLERIQLFDSFKIPENQMATFIHPLSYIAPDTKLSPGVVIMPGATVSSHALIGKNTLVMNNASIGHDNVIGKHCFFTSNSCTGSYINMGDGVWVGLNSTIRGRLDIGDYSAIGMGAVVTKSIKENELWIGNPAKFHKYVNEKITY